MTRLPRLGRRGEGWVALQVALLAAIVTAGALGSPWPAAAHGWLAATAGLAALGGLSLLLGGIAGLGRQITPFPRPVDQGSVRRGGAYALVRHPMYGGVLLLALGWSLASSPAALLTLAIAAGFLDAKRRREEAWLSERHPEYAEYRRGVRARFIPYVW